MENTLNAVPQELQCSSPKPISLRSDVPVEGKNLTDVCNWICLCSETISAPCCTTTEVEIN